MMVMGDLLIFECKLPLVFPLADMLVLQDDTTGAETVTYQLTPPQNALRSAPSTAPGKLLKGTASRGLRNTLNTGTPLQRGASRLNSATLAGIAEPCTYRL
jgi:hypothetical protein